MNKESINHILTTYFHSGWNTRLEKISKTDLLALTNINYIGLNVSDDGSVYFENNEDFDTITKIQKEYPNLKVVLVCNGNFNIAAVYHYDKTLKNILKSVYEHGFDGVEIGWRNPNRNEVIRKTHTKLIADLRTNFDNTSGKHYILSVACPPTEWCFEVTELNFSHKYIDYINIMSYDMYSDRTITTHHTAPCANSATPFLYNDVESNLQLFIDKGVPASKLIPSCGFYSRMWDNVPEGNKHGLLIETSATSLSTTYSLLTLKQYFIDKAGYTYYWDDEAKAPYLYNSTIKRFITYEDEQSVRKKCQLTKQYKTGGITVWEWSCIQGLNLLQDMEKWMNG